MDIVKELDLDWFWLGYTVGVSSRKSIKESPNKIDNLGKQGITTLPTTKQKISFFIGLIEGRRKIVNNLNIVVNLQYQDKNPHKSKGEYLTVEIGEKEAIKGETVSLPIYICNNSVDNRGFCGYQLKIKYNPTYLTFNSVSPTPSWVGSFEYQHDAKNGIVLIKGINENILYEDIIFSNIFFTVKETASTKNIVSLCGPSGSGQGTDILTRINGELYYIIPSNRKDGVVLVDGVKEEPKKESIPPIGDNNDIYGEDIDFTYDFTLGLFPVGESGSGASLIVGITTGDGKRVEVEIPLQEGEQHYKGKIPIKLPSISTGPIIIDYNIKKNDENDVYYWFIKAGALWGFESEIKREEVGEIPILEPTKSYFENFILIDGFKIESEIPTPIISDIEIEELFKLYSDFMSSSFKEEKKEDIDKMTFSDNFIISYDDT